MARTKQHPAAETLEPPEGIESRGAEDPTEEAPSRVPRKAFLHDGAGWNNDKQTVDLTRNGAWDLEYATNGVFFHPRPNRHAPTQGSVWVPYVQLRFVEFEPLPREPAAE
jgi:hypothetical protein